jgi:hypothetical protein
MLLAIPRSSLRRSAAVVVSSQRLVCRRFDDAASTGACRRRIFPELGRSQNDGLKLDLRRLKAGAQSDRLARECRSSKEADRTDLPPTASLQRIRSA